MVSFGLPAIALAHTERSDDSDDADSSEEDSCAVILSPLSGQNVHTPARAQGPPIRAPQDVAGAISRNLAVAGAPSNGGPSPIQGSQDVAGTSSAAGDPFVASKPVFNVDKMKRYRSAPASRKTVKV